MQESIIRFSRSDSVDDRTGAAVAVVFFLGMEDRFSCWPDFSFAFPFAVPLTPRAGRSCWNSSPEMMIRFKLRNLGFRIISFSRELERKRS